MSRAELRDGAVVDLARREEHLSDAEFAKVWSGVTLHVAQRLEAWDGAARALSSALCTCLAVAYAATDRTCMAAHTSPHTLTDTGKQAPQLCVAAHDCA